MMRSYLGLGSNLRAPTRQLRQAIAMLRKLPKSNIVKLSSIYSSKPLGVRAQPAYRNMVVAINTSLSPRRLLGYCQAIEKKQQRIRKLHWGSRTIDIDILLYGNQIIDSHHLLIPHPHMLTRDFVLVPLLEISPLAQLPDGNMVNSYLKYCETHVIPMHH